MPGLTEGKRILIVCDTTDGKPASRKDSRSYVQGVDRTAMNLVAVLTARGYRIHLLHPYLPQFFRIRVPTYSDVELAVNPFGNVRKELFSFRPDSIFIMTPEAPLGLYTAHLCRRLPEEQAAPALPYTAQYHTNYDIYFSIYLKRLTGGALDLPPEWFHPFLQYVYRDAHLTLVPTQSMEEKLRRIGISRTRIWPRGVDMVLFRPPVTGEKNPYEMYSWYRKTRKPVLLYFGRVAEEKGVERFLQDRPRNQSWHRVIIGEGPYGEELRKRYARRPDVHFLGKKLGGELAAFVRFADIHIFPSTTDTFGNTIIEAGASGVPTIAFDSPGPHDTIVPHVNGILVPPDTSLLAVIDAAERLSPATCREYILKSFSLDAAADTLIDSLQQINWQGWK